MVLVLVTGAALGTWGAQWLATGPGVGSEIRIPVPEVFGERVRVEVLNGGGQAGMAREATGHLRDRGFDVVKMGNRIPFDEDSSFVLDRVGDVETARRVADALRIPHVRSEPDPNLFADVSVVLGRDWSPDQLPALETEPRMTPWWDIRRFLKRPGAPTPPGARLADPDPNEDGT